MQNPAQPAGMNLMNPVLCTCKMKVSKVSSRIGINTGMRTERNIPGTICHHIICY